jgi:hypothetical protein
MESGTARIETIESLRWLKQRAGRGNAATYLVQIFNQPHQITILKVWHALLILFPREDVAEFVVEPG